MRSGWDHLPDSVKVQRKEAKKKKKKKKQANAFFFFGGAPAKRKETVQDDVHGGSWQSGITFVRIR